MGDGGRTLDGTVIDLGGSMVSTAVVTHPLRAGLVAELTAREPRLRPSVHCGVATRPSSDDALRNVLSAWRAVPAAATHHMVLQDDVRPCVGFLDRLAAAIACAPGRGFSMFCEWGSKTAQVIRIAALTGAGWAAVADPWLPAPAVVLPADLARGFAAYLEERMRDGERRDAFLLLTYLNGAGVDAVVSVPNLVEHDVPFTTSLLPNGKVRGPRRTTCLPSSAPQARDPRNPGTAWSSTVTRLPAALPYHSPHDLTAGVLSEWDGYYGWTTTPAFEWLADRGWSMADIDDGLRSTTVDVGLELEHAPLGHDSIRESWLAAFALGRVIAENDLASSASLPDPLFRDEVVVAALRSMAAGPFRRVLAPRLLDRWSDQAVALLGSALRAGTASHRK